MTTRGRRGAAARRRFAASLLGLGRLDVAFSAPVAPRRPPGRDRRRRRASRRGAARRPRSSVVVAAPLTTDQPAPRGDELSLRIAALVAGKLGAGSAGAPADRAASRRRAPSRGAPRARLRAAGDRPRATLRVTVDVYPSVANAWDRIRNPLPAPAAPRLRRRQIDAEVRDVSRAAPPRAGAASHRARHDEGDVLAAACGDVDGDGGDELVLVSRVARGDRPRARRRVRPGEDRAVERRSRRGRRCRCASRWRERWSRPAASTSGRRIAGAVGLGADSSGTPARSPACPRGAATESCASSPEPAPGAFDGAPFDCAMRPRSQARDGGARAALRRVRGGARRRRPGGAVDVVAVREPSGQAAHQARRRRVVPDGVFGAQLAVRRPRPGRRARGGDDGRRPRRTIAND